MSSLLLMGRRTRVFLTLTVLIVVGILIVAPRIARSPRHAARSGAPPGGHTGDGGIATDAAVNSLSP